MGGETEVRRQVVYTVLPYHHATQSALRRKRKDVRDRLAEYKTARAAWREFCREHPKSDIRREDLAWEAEEARRWWNTALDSLAYGLRIKKGIEDGSLNGNGVPWSELPHLARG